MASLQRTISRDIATKGMNKKQKKLFRAMLKKKKEG
jgi:hypothetical protein